MVVLSRAKVVNPGIDYDKYATTVSVIPIGSGAEIEAIVESYDIDRYREVENNMNWQFDDGNGFLFEPPIGVEKKYYGYVCDPIRLRQEMKDDGSKHSPIIGWAFDGNPIYGPYGYTNLKNDEDGVVKQKSAYRLLQSRLTVIPDYGTLPGLNPPGLSEYPMGSFVQDYRYDPTWFKEDQLVSDVSDGYLANESYQFLKTDKDQNLEIFYEVNPGMEPVIPDRLLDENNGKICNTPDFPEELYPDGVYCYFITLDDSDQPAFPYILGKTFHNRPISQAINIVSHESINVLPSGLVYKPHMVDGTTITFDFEKVERLRNPQLESTKEQLKLEIGEVSEGTIEDVIMEIPVAALMSVGDRVFFDNTNTGGAGAQAIVSMIEGVEVDSAEGSEIMTYVNSHYQKLDLTEEDLDGNPVSYTIVEGSTLSMSGSTEVIVNDYNDTSNELWSTATSKNLPSIGDVGFDAKSNPFSIIRARTLDEEVTADTLWLESVNHIESGDVLVIKNGSLYDSFIPHEQVLVRRRLMIIVSRSFVVILMIHCQFQMVQRLYTETSSYTQ